MEPEGLALEASWSCFDPTMSVEESEVMAQLFGPHNLANEQEQDRRTGIQQLFSSDQNADSYYCSDNSNYNPYCWSQGNYEGNSGEGYYLLEPQMVPAISVSSTPMNFSIGIEQIATPSFPVGAYHRFSEPVCIHEETSSDEVVDSIAKSLLPAAHAARAITRRLQVGDSEVPTKIEEDGNQMESPKRKAPAIAPATKKGKNAQKSKKAQRNVSTADEEESNADIIPQSSCYYSSEDDSNGSQELKGAGGMTSSSNGSAALNQNGKERAGRGSATDPQSLYARRRRQRINERLRILQNLVPNGTKVDISTMLEEAVQYVKFLQLQIKLLSSDDLWMYAPIAYNGMNLGFDLKTSK